MYARNWCFIRVAKGFFNKFWVQDVARGVCYFEFVNFLVDKLNFMGTRDKQVFCVMNESGYNRFTLAILANSCKEPVDAVSCISIVTAIEKTIKHNKWPIVKVYQFDNIKYCVDVSCFNNRQCKTVLLKLENIIFTVVNFGLRSRKDRLVNEDTC